MAADPRPDGRPLRVCVVGSGFTFFSGISLHTALTANALADRYRTSALLMRRLLPRRLYPGADRVGTDLTSLRYRDDVEVFDGVDYYWLPSMLRAIRFLRRERPDVVVLQWWSGTVLHSYLLLAAVARALGAQVVVEFHETLDTAEAAYPAVQRYVSALVGPLMRMVAGAVLHSEFDREPVERRFALGDRPTEVIPLGSYDHFLSAGPAGPVDLVRAEGGRDFNLLYFGTIRPYKGLENLIEAFNGLSDSEVAGRRLTVVGETWEGWTRPAELIAGSPHADRITFVNRYVHDEEAAGFFADADAVVLPYLRSSASGPLHIAMSAGLPVAVSDVGGLREAAGDYEGTTFVRPDSVEDLRSVLLDLPGRPRRRFTDPHDWNRAVQRFGDLFARLGLEPAAPARPVDPAAPDPAAPDPAAPDPAVPDPAGASR